MKVEFIQGEECCRINGELATDEWWEAQCGTTEDIQFGKDYIITADAIYIKRHTHLLSILQAVGTHHPKTAKYDVLYNKGFGQIQEWERSRILGDNGAFVIREAAWLKDFQIKRLFEFEIDYPKFNKRRYLQLQKALDRYYNKV